MKKRTRIEDVAKAANLSTATVSRYINNTSPVSEANSEKIQKAIDDLNYVPHSAAQILARQKTMTIGLVFPSLQSTFFNSLIRGIETRARQDGYSILIHTSDIDFVESRVKRVLGEHNTDGIIAFSDSMDDAELARLAKDNFPIVLIYRSSPPSLNIPTINVENKDGVYKLISHLIEIHNRKKIVLLRGPEKHENSVFREAGYRKALQDHNLQFDPELVEAGEFDSEFAHEAMRRMMNKKVKFDAVFAGDDDAASGVMVALREVGLSIPDDISVVGFDDQMFAARISPALTTVRSPIEKVGYQATDILVQLIQNKSVQAQTLFPTDLIIRESCGCKREITPVETADRL